MRFLQQGDVLFHEVELPKGEFEKLKTSTVQEGEHTGHAHRLQFRHDDIPGGSAKTNFVILQNKESGIRYLKVTNEPVNLAHEEHKTIAIPPGEYEIRIVQEYDHFAEEARQVQD